MKFHYNTSYAQTFRFLRYPADRAWYGLLAVLLIAAPFVLSKFYIGELAYLFPRVKAITPLTRKDCVKPEQTGRGVLDKKLT